ncbi:MAG TPA: hypothetical protein VHB25_21130 [Gemmatimonadaceae bacterium]|nr:hypothetical protein [Gemmatimonadaceae bacterium]
MKRTSFRSFSLRAGALLLIAALPAVAQEADPFNRLDPASRFSIELMIDSARTVGLPPQALRSLALEGIMLKVDGKKIVDRVRHQYALLKVARTTLGPVGDEELTAAAAVLNAGAKPAQLAAFKSRDKGRSDLQAFTVWADLITRGVPSEEASSAISKLWQDGADDATFYGLWKSVQTDISQGLNPGAALQNRIRETPVRTPQNKGAPPEG